MPAITIVGGGASGALLACQLVRRGPKGLLIALVEPRARLGLGQAYSTEEPTHLLNIPAGRMNALPEQPTAFADYLAGREDFGAGELPIAEVYAPRQTFGAFTAGLLNDCLAARGGPKLQHVAGSAVAIGGGERRFVALSDGRQITTDSIVLALGNPATRHPDGAGSWLHESPAYRHDPWTAGAFESIDSDATVLLLGTGLTMIDSVLTLLRRGHRGRMIALSRHGLLPLPHEAGPRIARDLPFDPERPPGVAQLLRIVRARARRAEAEGDDWRGVMDGLRASAQTVWTHLSDSEQARFLRHARAWWEVHRHRVAPDVWQAISPLLESGQLQTVAAHVRRYVPADGGIEITAVRRHTREEIRLRGAVLVNCTGPNMDIGSTDDRLLRQLAMDGHITPGPHRLGIDVTRDLAVVGRSGAVSPGLYALGPLLRGRLWETTSVPEIGQQAADLSAMLLRRHALTA